MLRSWLGPILFSFTLAAVQAADPKAGTKELAAYVGTLPFAEIPAFT
jgi:hypothetical protein